MSEIDTASTPTEPGERGALSVEIWFDFACPWCQIGFRRWGDALGRFAHADRVETRWRSFELRPGYAETPSRPLVDIMLSDWGMDEPTVTGIVERIRAEGRAAGLVLRPEGLRPTSTFDAHRLAHAAAEHGFGDVMRKSLFAACHRDLGDLADRGLLTELASAAGLSRTETARLWSTDAYADVVRAEHARAATAGVSEVPAFRLGGRVHSGSPATGDLLGLLDQAWREQASGAD
ncbi:putative DsbA family dithiol-disulfide isomerase [Actinoalloteichus hoggarensis]|uniref:DSBA-like thioredoxin domain protein n=1 Tax=Actinoalloteichus hoggarensis TaxID=1470176 RepID=A0A221W126_9PSEU|nr:DsbA family oxidoreductase [Actinoalloteichus hoggarensis]ASO19487.1 DSBA-like thioredoxin domain protein [Actinoalloteichus hoggarensis]MBB5919807.1 putative DsbA family dithiol-disulfide isomerase [Actinoalloteichus hoggarensis]